MRSLLLLSLILLLPFGYLTAQTSESTGEVIPSAASDSLQCREQFSLYREYYKINLFTHALPHWRYIFANCPTSSQNTYIDGIKMMNTFIEEAKDPQSREQLIDTLMMVYDQRIQHYGREGYVLGRKSIDAITLRPDALETVYPWFNRSVELQGNASEGPVLVYFLTTAIQLSNKGAIEKAEIFTTYDKVISIADYNLTNATDDKAKSAWSNIKASIETIIEPHASCDDLVAIYDKKFTQTPDDIALLKNITNMLERRNCTSTGDLFYKATANLHKLEPGAQSAYLMGRLSIQNNQLTKAAEYMQEASELFTETEDKIKALYVLAGIHSNSKNYTQSRNTAYKILQLNPNEGKAYILIGDLYAMSASNCKEDDLDGKTVFWAAIDKYIKARQVDNTVEEQANSKINQYSQYFPPSSDLFFRDMEAGANYTVGCWINENTIIRAAK